MPRGTDSTIILPSSAVLGYYSRFDLHLPRQPWLPEVELLARGLDMAETWLREPAQVTVAELRLRLNGMVEDTCEWLLGVWNQASNGYLQAPANSWRLPTEPRIDFAGMKPDHPTVELAGAITGDDGFLRLAKRLREHTAATTRPEESIEGESASNLEASE
jgi:hypothetical protein